MCYHLSNEKITDTNHFWSRQTWYSEFACKPIVYSSKTKRDLNKNSGLNSIKLLITTFEYSIS